MNIILLSGGSGKRLWPLSNDIRSKQFIKLFKKSTGIGFAKYLLSFKLKEAVVLLQTTSMSITDIALNTGFNSSQYFCKAFKIQCGTSPFQFRNDFYNREFPDISVK